MTYKESLFFIGKCLTISHEKHNLEIVKKQILANTIHWNTIVTVATDHYVFPALYCSLEKMKLTQHLPNDLVEYMKYIADLNRERNILIITQASEINVLLKAHNIEPIFLKGTGNLINNLYQDMAERMVGDIDFLVSKDVFEKTINVLKNNGYRSNFDESIYLDFSKHFPRMTKDKRIGAIEIHQEMTIKKIRPFFNYETVVHNTLVKNTIQILGYKDQLLHTIINNQINDMEYAFKNISLRNYYDSLLLTYKTNTYAFIPPFSSATKYVNSFLYTASKLFHIKSLEPTSTTRALVNYSFTRFLLKRLTLKKNYCLLLKTYFFLTDRVVIVIKAFYSKKHFLFVKEKLTTIDWYKRRFLGIK